MELLRLGVALVCGASAVLGAGRARASEFENAIVYPVDEASPAQPRAEPERPRHHFDEKPYYLEMRTGWATTVGVIGVVGEYDLTDRLALGTGFGSNLYGYDVEAHARFRPIVGASVNGHTLSALTIEGAVANGTYGAPLATLFCGLLDSQELCTSVVPQQVFWGQLELGWEMRLGSGMTIRVAVGGATLLGSYRWRCTENHSDVGCDARDLPARSLFTQTIGYGLAF